MTPYVLLGLLALTHALKIQTPVPEPSADVVARGPPTSSCRWVTTHGGVATCVTSSTSSTKSRPTSAAWMTVPLSQRSSKSATTTTTTTTTTKKKTTTTPKSDLTFSRRSSTTTSRRSTYVPTTRPTGATTTRSGLSTTTKSGTNASSRVAATTTSQSVRVATTLSRNTLSSSTTGTGSPKPTLSSTSSIAASSRSSTPSATTTTKTSASVTPAPTSFRIAVQAGGPTRNKRLVLYVQFAGDNAQLTDDASQASTFTIVDGYLMYGNEYVNTDSSNGYASFAKSSTKPTSAGTWSDNGGQVSFSGAQGFCYAADQSLYIITSQQPPFACTAASLVENAAINSTPIPSSFTKAGSITRSAGSSWSGSMQVGTRTTTPQTTSTTISCTEGVYTATARCSCRWSLRCNSHAVSEFGFEPDTSSASNAIDCIEQCNANVNCGGLYYDPGSSTCYTFDSAGDNVLFGYNTGPWIAAGRIDCDESCAVHTTTLVTTTASTTTAAPTPTTPVCRYEEYQATSGGCDCVWPIKCGTQVYTTPDVQQTLPDHHACVNLCDLTSRCQLFTYDPTDSQCRIWYDGDQPASAAEGVYWCARLDNWCPDSQCPA